MADQEIWGVKERQKGVLLAKANVVGVGVGYKFRRGLRTESVCVVTLVRVKRPRDQLLDRDLVPAHVEGVATDVIEVGELRPLQSPTDRWRPAPGGVSVGHPSITAGTLATVVRDRGSGRRLILSNNHVLADSNRGAPGDQILQPGAADGGRAGRDEIARLERFVPISFSLDTATCPVAQGVAGIASGIGRAIGSKHQLVAIQVDENASNEVDAAVATPLADDVVSDEIHEVGVVLGLGTRDPELGLPVLKSGRSTGRTAGEITVLSATVYVNYGTSPLEDRIARYENQIVTSEMSAPGDSGSLLVDAGSHHAVGLLFAGSDRITLHNPIAGVLALLDVEI